MSFEKLGPRICVMGPSCSGKSTLAQKLGEEMKAPAIHLDQLAHEPGTNWQRRSDEDFVKAHDAIIAGESWVIEGNYAVCLPQRLARATGVVYLDTPVWLCLWRYLRRSLRNDENRPGRLKDAKRELNWFMPWYTLTQYPKKRPGYFEAIKANPHLRVQVVTKPPI